jgi:hypothetical protein
MCDPDSVTQNKDYPESISDKIVNKDYYLLRCGAVKSGRNSPMFRKNILPPFLVPKSKPSKSTRKT